MFFVLIFIGLTATLWLLRTRSVNKIFRKNLVSSTISALPARSRVRRTIRAIIIAIGILIVAMWTAIAFSVVTARQQALDAADSQGRNLMIAFREEVATILRGVEGETNLLAEKLRRERGSLDLYIWGRENLVASHGISQATIIGPDGMIRSTTLEPHTRETDLSDRPHFRVHLDGKFKGLYIGPSIIARTSGLPGLPISRRVDAEDGTFLGVLVVLISVLVSVYIFLFDNIFHLLVDKLILGIPDVTPAPPTQ